MPIAGQGEIYVRMVERVQTANVNVQRDSRIVKLALPHLPASIQTIVICIANAVNPALAQIVPQRTRFVQPTAVLPLVLAPLSYAKAHVSTNRLPMSQVAMQHPLLVQPIMPMSMAQSRMVVKSISKRTMIIAVQKVINVRMAERVQTASANVLRG